MQYSQVRAMLAITKGSLTAIMRSPSAVIFSFIFPFIFILVFGFIGNRDGVPVYTVAINPKSDTSNALYQAMKSSDRLRIVSFENEKELQQNIVKGRIAGIVTISKTGGQSPQYRYTISSSNASADKWPQLIPLMESMVNRINHSLYTASPTYAVLDFNKERDITVVREYRTIDFILPGQLGFSLLSSGVFGVAFMFFNLRNTLVLKRFFATPISRTYIVLGEGISRVIFQMLTSIVIILVGYFLFNFTLVNGVETFLEMMALSFLGLLIFMGLGFIVSGLAKNDSSIPPFANLITLPQFLLGGTFFSVDNFPGWLQPISKVLPLTHLNTAMRRVAFEGQNLWDIRQEIGILFIWGIVVYIIAVKVFKWE